MTSVETASISSPSDHFKFVSFEPLLLRTGLAMCVLFALTLIAYQFDARLFEGENVWLKPLRFQLALGVYCLTVSLFAGTWNTSLFASPRMAWYLRLVVACIAIEMVWVMGAALYGTDSHYNTGPIMSVIYGFMGVAAIILTSVTWVVGRAYWKGINASGRPVLTLSIALGLMLTFALTIPVASVLSAIPEDVIGSAPTGESLTVLGWSREAGDLHVAHFLATHALHALPVLGFALSGLSNQKRAAIFVYAGAVAYAVLVFGTLVHALLGYPFLA